jgi:hypothetical protein
VLVPYQDKQNCQEYGRTEQGRERAVNLVERACAHGSGNKSDGRAGTDQAGGGTLL